MVHFVEVQFVWRAAFDRRPPPCLQRRQEGLLLGVEQPHQALAVRHRPQREEALENIAGVVDGDIAVAAG